MVHTDATALLRPKTGLKDMFIDLQPGGGDAPVAKRGLHDPDRGDAARRQPRRDPLGARHRHARLPAAAGQRRSAGASKGRGGDLRDLLAPLRADPPRPRARQRRGRRRAASSCATSISSLNPAQRRAGQARRRPRAAGQLLLRASSTRSPRSRPTSPPPCTSCRARCADDRHARPRRQRSPSVLGPTTEKLRPAARALAPANEAVRPFAKEATPQLRERHPPVRARVAPAGARPAAGLDAQPPTPRPPDAGRSLRSTTSSTCSATTRTAARARSKAARQEGYLFWLAWLNTLGHRSCSRPPTPTACSARSRSRRRARRSSRSCRRSRRSSSPRC